MYFYSWRLLSKLTTEANGANGFSIKKLRFKI